MRLPPYMREESAMKDKTVFFNPLRLLSPKLDEQVERIEELYKRPFSESVTFEEGLLIMISKAIEMVRLLSTCILTGSESKMESCQLLAKDLHRQEKVLTKNLVAAGLKAELLRGVLHLPFRLERIGDLLENILNGCRIRARDGIPFSDIAEKELGQIFTFMLDMMNNLRDALVTPNKVLIEHILSQGRELNQMLGDFRLAHWDRMEKGFCSPEAGSLYLDILDSVKQMSEYMEKMANSLLELSKPAQ